MNFEESVVRRSHEIPLLVDFWAPWCGPCRSLGPVLDRVAQDHAGRLELVKLNTEEHPELAARFGIRSIPHCKLFVDGAIAAEFSGALPQQAVESWLQQNLPSPHAGTIAQAAQALSAGDAQQALRLIEPVLQTEPQNDAALLLAARAQLLSAPEQAAERLGAVPVNADGATRADQLKALAQQLLKPPAMDNETAAAHHREALQKLREQDVPGAEDALLACLRADRHGGDDAARKALLGLMAWWGDDTPRVDDLRRRMSAVLFS